MKPTTLYWLLGLGAAAALLRRRSSAAAVPAATGAARPPFALPTDEDYAARRPSLMDRYRSYLATTRLATPLSYEEWLSIELGESQDSTGAAGQHYYSGGAYGTTPY